MAGRQGLHRAIPAAAEAHPDTSHRADDASRDEHLHRGGEPSFDDMLEAVLGAGEGDEVVTRIADVGARTRCDVEGEVVSVGRATGPIVALDVVLSDGTGHLLCHFFGRAAIAGVAVSARLRVAGRLATYRSRRCLLNPTYELVGHPSSGADSS